MQYHWFAVLNEMLRPIILNMAFCLACTAISVAQTGGFSVPVDTAEDIGVDYVPREKANLFGGKPGRAALYSLILPGAGQAYNKKYWQVPIVWGAIGAAGVVMIDNTNQYRGYRAAYNAHLIAELNMEPPPNLELPYGRYSQDQLRNIRNEYNRLRQLSIIVLSAVWLANSAQAYVSAHLKDFDMDDDLSFQVVPFKGVDTAFGSIPSAAILVSF